jgi:hypothetical protein
MTLCSEGLHCIHGTELYKFSLLLWKMFHSYLKIKKVNYCAL